MPVPIVTSIVMLVWKELLHYLGQRLLLLTVAELEHLRTVSIDDIVKHLRDLAAKVESRNGGSLPSESPLRLLDDDEPARWDTYPNWLLPQRKD